MMQVISAWGPLIYAGCFAATLSSAISSLEGAPRVLQALAKDDIFPYLEPFGVGHGKNNDPFRAYIAVFGISLICILIADLDVVSSLLSNFFIAAYALINFSVFHASVTNSPGWRPSFKYYNKWLSLLGTILCISVMFLIEKRTALVTFLVIIILYLCVCYRKPNANWGSSTQVSEQYEGCKYQVLNINRTRVFGYLFTADCLLKPANKNILPLKLRHTQYARNYLLGPEVLFTILQTCFNTRHNHS